MAELPDSVTIFGKRYSIEYKDNPAEVDLYRRQSFWGQVDYWTHSIRIYAPDGFSGVEILDALIHEMLHAIAVELKLDLGKDENHDELGLLAMALADTFSRNGWLVPELVNGR